MQVRECMSADVCTIEIDTPLKVAAEKMASRDLGFLPVEDHDRLIGMVTDRDITVRGIGQGWGPDARAAEVMTEEVLYCDVDADVDDVLENMGQLQVRRLPVVDKQKQLVGVVSISDLAKTEPSETGEAFAKVAEPSSLHSQSLAQSQRSGGESGKHDIVSPTLKELDELRRRMRSSGSHALIASNRVEGTKVYRPNGDKIGKIDHFMVDKRSGHVEYAIMSFGGFLGLGEELRPIPWDALDYDIELDGYVVSADEDTFRNSPYIEGGTVPEWDSAYARSLYTYWGVPY